MSYDPAMPELIALVEEEGDLLFGDSPASTRLLSQIERVAGTPRTTVLLRGERGRELELVASAIHARSRPALDGLDHGFDPKGPFLRVECAELSAIPGATIREDRIFAGDGGLFERARTGTLFLDEVADLAVTLQGHLLDLLERRAAETPPLRVIASTAKDLEPEVEAERFRADLFYRLNVLTIRVPALRDRLDDIPALAGAVLRRLRGLLGVQTTLSPEAVASLAAHDWPGNLFELEATLARAALAAQSGRIDPEHLNLGPPQGSRDELIPAASDRRSLRHVEEEAIRRVLIEEGGNRSRAARTLGINRTTLYNKLRQYGIA